MLTVVGILVVAVLAGLFGSMLGVGGGIIMVPMLTLAFGAPIKTAIAASIVCVIATSSVAQTVFVRRGMTNVRLGMALEVATSVGAITGGITAVLVDGRLLQVAFAAVLIYVAWQMRRRGGDVKPKQTGVLEATYRDPADGRLVTYGVERPRLGFFLCLGAGNVSGLLGIGGGAFKVPIMNLLMGVPLKATVATSNLMIGVTAATGAAIFYGRGYLDPYYAVPAVARYPRGRELRAARRHAYAQRDARARLPDRPAGVRRSHGAGGSGGGRVSDERRLMPELAATPPGHEMDPIERLIRTILLIGIAISVALMAAGLVLAAAHGEEIPNGVVPVRELPAALAGLDAAAYLSLGLIVLVATPFVRVAGSIVAFALERERRWVAVTSVVFAVMCLSVLLGEV